MLTVWLILWLLLLGAAPASADPITLTILSLVGITGVSATAVSIISAVGSIVLSFGINYVATKLLTKKPAAQQRVETGPEPGGAQLDTRVGADIPYSLIVGRAVTAGSRVFTGTGGVVGETQNANLIEIIALADHPCYRLAGVFIGGLPAALYNYSSLDDPNLGANVNGYKGTIGQRTKDNYLAMFGLPSFGADSANGAAAEGGSNPTILVNYDRHLHVRFYDGTQTVADSIAVETTIGTQPSWPSTAIGTGVTYVRIRSVYDQEKVPGMMAWKFVVDGIKLYDPRKDSTVGGSGSHVWGNQATYEWTDNVAVIVYNIVRGIYVGSEFFYGIEGTTADQLPLDIWFAAMNECDVSVAIDPILGGSAEPQFTAGGEIGIGTDPLDAITALLKACGGRFVEIGGVYKLYVGPPGVQVLTFDDGQIRANASDVFNMVLPLEQRVNYITGTYTTPDGWIDKVAPPRQDAAFIIEDGRRLPSDLSAAMVQSDTQMQRLQLQLLQRARRERKHVIPLPPIGMVLEPGDVFAWNSARNGYIDKLFEIDGIDYDANLNVTVSATEVDHADYDWDAGLAFPTGSGHIIVHEPIPMVVAGFSVDPFTYTGDDATAVPALKLMWDNPNNPDAISILWELRVTADPGNATSGMGHDVAFESLIIVGGLQPVTAYQVRARFGSSVGFASAWSLWIDVTTEDIRPSLADFEAALTALVTEEFRKITDAMQAIEDQIATAVAEQDAQNWLDKAARKTDLVTTATDLKTGIDTQQVIFEDFELSYAGYQTTVQATFENAQARIVQNSTAIADQYGAFASYQVVVSAAFASTNANVTTNATAIASNTGAIASLTTTVSAQGVSITNNATAISTVDGKFLAQWGVTLDVNGYISYVKAFNSGSLSGWTFVGDIFAVAFPGSPSVPPWPIFTIANVSGNPRVTIRADVLADGTISARSMAVGSITAINAAIATAAVTEANIQNAAITSAKIANATINTAHINDLQVETFKIAGHAITAPASAADNSVFGFNNTSYTLFLSVSSTVTLESGYTYFAKVDAYINYDRAGLGYVQAALVVNGSIVQEIGLDVKVPFVFVYALPQTGSGGPQNVSAEIHMLTNGAPVTVKARYLSIQVIKR